MKAAVLLLLWASSARAAYPCRLDALGYRPDVLLVGENHCDAGSRAVKRRAWDLARGGQLAVGQEGLYRGDDEEGAQGIFGIEEPFSHGLVLSYFGGLNERICELSDEEAAFTTVANMARNEHSQDAWGLAFEQEGGEAMARRSWAAQVIDKGSRGFTITLDDFRQLRADDEEFAELQRLLRVVNVFYVQAANERRAELGIARPLVALPVDLHAPRLPSEQAAVRSALDSMEQVIVPVRDREMAANLESLYCGAARSGRGVVAVVGSAHLPGISNYLTRDSGGLVRPRLVDSEREPDRAMRELAAVSARRAARTLGRAPSSLELDWR